MSQVTTTRQPSAPFAFGASIRTSPRVEVDLGVRYRADGHPSAVGRARNISSEGLFVATQRPLPAGTEVFVELSADGRCLRGVAMVQWSRHTNVGVTTPAGMGLRMLSRHGSDVAAWEALVDRETQLALSDANRPEEASRRAPASVVQPWLEPMSTESPGVAAPMPKKSAAQPWPASLLLILSAATIVALLLL